MKTNHFTLLTILFATIAVTICLSETAKGATRAELESMNPPPLNVTYESLDTLKKDYSTYHCEWLDVTCEDRKYAVCLVALPSYGSSYHFVHGWTSTGKKSWEPFLDYRIREIGAAKLEFSAAEKQIRLRGSANNKYSNVVVLMVNVH